jgi:hypothetical protein
MFNREIQVRTVRVPQAGENDGDSNVINLNQFDHKAEVITKATKSVLGTVIIGLVSYIAADMVRRVVVEASTQKPYWVDTATKKTK